MTRAVALEHLAAALPGCGLDYATRRNTDAGTGRTPTTTALSPFLRRRLILEQEVVAAAIARHGQQAAKLVDEVFWRTYFKGHLETRPAIWSNYRALVATGTEQLARSSGLNRAYLDAVAGRTGIDGFDHWARQLVDTGWLHNHARMWFASIWIFTLKLPWALGADHFLRHLLDGDPASNTLSWRWVAGLHTRGKHYVARAENIRRHTEGRFSPTGLDESPVSLEEGTSVAARSLPLSGQAPTGDVALLLHLDDLHPESLHLGGARVARIGALVAHAPDASEPVKQADRTAMADALARARAHFDCAAVTAVETGDGDWNGGLPVVAAWSPVGPSADRLPVNRLQLRREWDELTWPRATRGYFQVRTAIPDILRALTPAVY